MGGVFLTEGHRIKPQMNRRAKQKHPWRGTAIPTNARFPVRASTDEDGDEIMNNPGLPTGCYVTRQKTRSCE